jgi:hypothetical protein
MHPTGAVLQSVPYDVTRDTMSEFIKRKVDLILTI